MILSFNKHLHVSITQMISLIQQLIAKGSRLIAVPLFSEQIINRSVYSCFVNSLKRQTVRAWTGGDLAWHSLTSRFVSSRPEEQSGNDTSNG